VIAKIVGLNIRGKSAFVERLPMYTFEEMVSGEKLTEIINTRHENVKYLPGYKLPDNVVCWPIVCLQLTGLFLIRTMFLVYLSAFSRWLFSMWLMSTMFVIYCMCSFNHYAAASDVVHEAVLLIYCLWSLIGRSRCGQCL